MVRSAEATTARYRKPRASDSSEMATKPTTQTVDWLLARHDPQTGGFFAAQDAPLPDLLSTATALFTLSLMNIPIDNLRSQSTEFVQLLWDDTGGFCGSPADTVPDCEYTFYALLALGCLGVRRKDEG